MTPAFSVITPCYNAVRWIRGCVESVADQTGVVVEHIIQDGGSRDGTAEYLLSEPRVIAESKPDKGMYDAINRGWAKAKGEFVLHLNADEELLPGALEAVASYFQAHTDVDVVLAGTLICEADGSLHCFRKPMHPPLSVLLTCYHPVPTCGIFLRRSAFVEREWLYDPNFRHISDVLLMIDIVREKKNVAILNRYTSVFMLTGTNIGLTQSAEVKREYSYRMSLASRWMQARQPLIRAGFILRKILSGHYREGSLTYDIYLPGKEHARQRFVVPKPSGVYSPLQTEDVHA